MSFCFLYTVVLENYSVQNPLPPPPTTPAGEVGSIAGPRSIGLGKVISMECFVNIVAELPLQLYIGQCLTCLTCLTNDFTSLYRTVSHNLFKTRLTDLIVSIFQRDSPLIVLVMIGMLSLLLMSKNALIFGPFKIYTTYYPTELLLSKANSAGTDAQVLDLNLSISNSFVSAKVYDKHHVFFFFLFDIVNFTFFDIPRDPS